MYNALTVANFVIEYCNRIGRGISNLKLQKMLYFIQAEFLVFANKPCFSDTIEAWDFGPVVPSVYHRYKVYGSAIIPFSSEMALHEVITTEDKNMIIAMIDQVATYSASQLVELTHRQDPWKASYIRGCNNVITNNSIRKYFEE